MAITQNPLIGRASGSVGNFTFSTLYGHNIVKTKSMGTSLPPSAAMILQRNKFANCVSFYKKNMSLLGFHLASMAVKMSAFNAFVKLNIGIFSTVANTAISTAAVDLKFAIGSLDVITPVTCVATTLLKITINATLITDMAKSKATDIVCILCHNRTTGIISKFEILRSAWTASNVITTTFAAGTVVDVFALTHDANANLHSTSVFLNTVTILA